MVDLQGGEDGAVYRSVQLNAALADDRFTGSISETAPKVRVNHGLCALCVAYAVDRNFETLEWLYETGTVRRV